MEKTVIESYKEKYGRVYMVTATVVDVDNDCEEKEIEFVFKQPGPKDYDRFIMDSSKKPSAAFKNLLISSIVEEQRSELEETLTNHPAVAASLASQLLKLMGLSDNVNLKKL